MNPSEQQEQPLKRKEDESEAELLARLEQRRGEFLQAASVLRTPLRTVNRADSVIRTVLPILPYAISAITVIGVAASLIRGRRVRPTILLATGLDMWRLWKNFQANSSLSTASTVRPAQLSSGESQK